MRNASRLQEKEFFTEKLVELSETSFLLRLFLLSGEGQKETVGSQVIPYRSQAG